MSLLRTPIARRVTATGVRGLATVAGTSWLTDVPQGPPDAILGLTEAFNKDPAETKVSLGVGAYRDDQGKPFVLPSVRKAEAKLLAEALNHEYAGIVGVADFVSESLKFAYGEDASVLAEGRVAGTQTLSGTGALRVAGEIFNRFKGQGGAIYMPSPTWGNHLPIMRDAGLEPRSYSYYDPTTCGLNFGAMLDDIQNAPDGSTFLLHACAHNPTGVDPTPDQWREVSDLFKTKGHMAFFDCAYQGFASGDAERDAFALRHFVSEGHNIALSQSFSKNFGLYGERVGALSFVCSSPEEKERMLSQLKIMIRPMYSNPPVYGARLVSLILSDPTLRREWAEECLGMANRINSMRSVLVQLLAEAGSTRSWQHITQQIGMFCYSGLTKDQVEALRDQHHIYMTLDGRISMAGVTSGNVKYLASCMHDVTK